MYQSYLVTSTAAVEADPVVAAGGARQRTDGIVLLRCLVVGKVASGPVAVSSLLGVFDSIIVIAAVFDKLIVVSLILKEPRLGGCAARGERG